MQSYLVECLMVPKREFLFLLTSSSLPVVICGMDTFVDLNHFALFFIYVKIIIIIMIVILKSITFCYCVTVPTLAIG